MFIKSFLIKQIIFDSLIKRVSLNLNDFLKISFFRWDIGCIELLPEYMRYCYQALLDVYDEIKQEVAKEGREFCMKYAKDEV